jgi:hypothetical protein
MTFIRCRMSYAIKLAVSQFKSSAAKSFSRHSRCTLRLTDLSVTSNRQPIRPCGCRAMRHEPLIFRQPLYCIGLQSGKFQQSEKGIPVQTQCMDPTVYERRLLVSFKTRYEACPISMNLDAKNPVLFGIHRRFSSN